MSTNRRAAPLWALTDKPVVCKHCSTIKRKFHEQVHCRCAGRHLRCRNLHPGICRGREERREEDGEEGRKEVTGFFPGKGRVRPCLFYCPRAASGARVAILRDMG